MKSKIVLILIILTILTSCGGGSSGTGVPDSFIGKVLNGSVVDETQAPVSGATVTVLESGENSTTDESGSFSLTSSIEGNINLAVDIGETTSTVNINTEDSSRSDIKITVNRRTGFANATNLSATAKIVGSCDPAFENNAIIRQSNKIASGTQCPVQVRVRSSGRGVSGIPFKVEHKACESTAPWRKDFEELTSNVGVGQANFKFNDGESFCDYRIVVAYDVTGVKEIVFPVITFRRQAKDK